MLTVRPHHPPSSEDELIERARAIAGMTLGSLAAVGDEEVPPNLKRAKGWVGQLIERSLGATASSRPTPDFEGLGVELKTIPIDRKGRPFETTFVCTAPLSKMRELTWQTSHVREKLARVLWIPILSERDLAIADRRVGSPLLWSPSEAEESLLANDWRSIADVIAAGFVESISAERGEVLQLRPKGSNASARRWGTDEEGDEMWTAPRAFYLRTRFTAALLRNHFAIAG